MLIDWTASLPDKTTIVMNSLHDPEDPLELDGTVFHAILPNGSGIDVEWDDDNQNYILSVFNEDFDSISHRETVTGIKTLRNRLTEIAGQL